MKISATFDDLIKANQEFNLAGSVFGAQIYTHHAIPKGLIWGITPDTTVEFDVPTAYDEFFP